MVKKLLLLGLLIIASYFLLPKTATASTLLYDDFNDGNTNDGNPTDWEEYLGIDGKWWIDNGEYVGKVIKAGPDLPTYSLAGNENWTDYRFDVRIKGDAGVDKLILFRYKSLSEMYAIKMISDWWDWYGNKIALLKNNLIGGWYTSASFPNFKSIFYKLSVEARGSSIKVYVNDATQPIIEYTDMNDPNLTGKIGLLVWPGASGSDGPLTINRFDDVLVCDFNEPCEIPTTTPTPTPIPQLDNLIFLPGMGSSWNHEAMILGQQKEAEDWYMTPGVRVYDGLIQTFKNAGYETEGENKNLFIFNYDWRKPVEEIAYDLKEYIGRHPPPSGSKIDLVGHSLGGLVARTYIQNNLNNQVDQLVTIGSPHQGAVKAYYLWEGAQLSKGLSGWQRIGAGILLQLNKREFETRVETIQHMIPGIKDLLPTFPYLKQGGIAKPIVEMKVRNLWLENLNTPPLPTSLIQTLNTLVGVKTDSTLRWIHLQKRNNLDKLLGNWEDGKPTSEEYGTGDDTVLDFSASPDWVTQKVEISNLDHSGLVETTPGQQVIMNLLNLSPSEFVPAPQPAYVPSLVFQIASPATITVHDPNGFLIEENKKLVVIPNAQKGGYRVDVYSENGGGDYRLFIGKITEKGDVWNEEDGTVTNLPHSYTIGFDPELKNTKDELVHLAVGKLESARMKALNQEKPISLALVSHIEARSRDLKRLLSFFDQGKTEQLTGGIDQAILGIDRLETHINQWPQTDFMPPEEKTEILYLIREAEDYLVQAYDLE